MSKKNSNVNSRKFPEIFDCHGKTFSNKNLIVYKIERKTFDVFELLK